MREQFPNHDKPDTFARERWILVSDPFEKPKIYRYVDAFIAVDQPLSFQKQRKGVHLFFTEQPSVGPILMHDIPGVEEDLVLTLLIEGEPVEAGFVNGIPAYNSEGFLNLTPDDHEWTLLRWALDGTSIEQISKGRDPLQFRLKTADDSYSQRGFITGPEWRAFYDALQNIMED